MVLDVVLSVPPRVNWIGQQDVDRYPCLCFNHCLHVATPVEKMRSSSYAFIICRFCVYISSDIHMFCSLSAPDLQG